MSSLFPPVLDVPFARGPSCLPIKLKHRHNHTLSILSQFPPVCYNVPSSLCVSFFLSVGLCLPFFLFLFFFSFSSLFSPSDWYTDILFPIYGGKLAGRKLGCRANTTTRAPLHQTRNIQYNDDFRAGDKHSVDVWARTAANKQMMNPVITALGSRCAFLRPSPSLISVSLFSRQPLFSRHVSSPPRSLWSPRGTERKILAVRREHNPAQCHSKSRTKKKKKDESSPFGRLPARLHPRLSPRVIPLHKFGAYRRLLQLARSCWWTHGALATMGFRQKR